MPVPAELLADARKYRSAALATLLESYYPTVYRIAHSLCEKDAAQQVIVRVFARALHVLPKWRDDSAADRWFYHFTIQETRRHAVESPEARLATDSMGTAYARFLHSMNELPPQQREAIVLHHGEHLNLRFLGVAMDCSTDAAANHLRAASFALESSEGEYCVEGFRRFSDFYGGLLPAPESARPMILGRIRRHMAPRRLRRALFGLVAVAAYILWRWL